MGWTVPQMLFKHCRVLRGSNVMIMRGKDKGWTGNVTAGLRSINNVLVDGRNLCTVSAPSSSGEESYDVVVVGGGMVGAAVGCGLASSPLTSSLRVAIVDGKPATQSNSLNHEVPNARVSAITPTTVSFLKDVGAWESVLKYRHALFESMQVWDYSGKGFTRYEAADVGEDVLGYVVENDVLVYSLQNALQRSGFAEVICPAQVQDVQFSSPTSFKKSKSAQSGLGSVELEDGWARLILADGKVLRSRLVVGADGGQSKVRAMAGLNTTGWDYHQQALICTVKVGYKHSTAWQRFLPAGPIALLPMGGEHSNIVWSTTAERANALKAMSEEEFVLEANRALTEDYGPLPNSEVEGAFVSKWLTPFLGVLPPSARKPFCIPPPVTKCLSPRLSFPLSLRHANSYVSTRLALVGDAAHTVHPLAGQGVNLGFGDASSLVKILGEGVKRGADVGELALLEKYQSERMWANVPMMAVLDGFQRVFSADFFPLNVARAVGFNAANYVRPLKQRIISFAMGGKT